MFWLQLHINGLLVSGTRLKDMPSEWFELSEDADLSNPIVSSIGVYKCGYLHDKRLFDEAKKESENILNKAPALLEIYKNELGCELLFYEIIDQCRDEIIKKLYTNQLKKYIKATSSYVSRKRLMYAYVLLVEKDEEKAKKELELFEKATKTYPYQTEIDSERELIKMIKELAESRN